MYNNQIIVTQLLDMWQINLLGDRQMIATSLLDNGLPCWWGGAVNLFWHVTTALQFVSKQIHDSSPPIQISNAWYMVNNCCKYSPRAAMLRLSEFHLSICICQCNAFDYHLGLGTCYNITSSCQIRIKDWSWWLLFCCQKNGQTSWRNGGVQLQTGPGFWTSRVLGALSV